MHRFCTSFLRDLKNNIFGSKFVLAALMCSCTCMLPTVSYVTEGTQKSNSVLRIIFLKNLKNIVKNNADLYSENIVSQFAYSYWFSMLLITICAFPAVSRFADEYYSGYFYLCISRGSVWRYSLTKYLSGLVSGAVVFVTGFAVFSGFITLRFPSQRECSEQMIVENVWELGGDVLHVTLVAVIYTAVVMALSTFIQDRYFLFGIPALILFFTGRVSMYIGDLHTEIYDQGKGWWNLLVLQNYPALNKTFTWNTGFTYNLFYAIALLEVVVLFILFYRRVERRLKRNG